MIIRGKYTFVIIPDALNKLPLEPARALEKYVHGTKAVKLKIAYARHLNQSLLAYQKQL